MSGFLYKAIKRTPSTMTTTTTEVDTPWLEQSLPAPRSTTSVSTPETPRIPLPTSGPILPFEAKKRGSVYSDGINLGNMQWIKDLLEEEGINGRITSGLRPGAVTSSGHQSYHSTGDAIDLVAADGEDLNSLYDAMIKNTRIVKALQDRGYGILRETTNGALAKTGGSGYHYHIGKDSKAIEDLNRGLQGLGPILARKGTKLGYNPIERETEDNIGNYVSYYAPEYNLSAPEDGIGDWLGAIAKPVVEKAKAILPIVKQATNKKKGPVDWSKVRTTNNRGINVDYINKIVDNLNGSQLNPYQKSAILANIIEESGGNPMAIDDTHQFQGLLQWGADRYIPNWNNDDLSEIDNQMKYIYDTISNSTDRKSWTHGGEGSGYMRAIDAMNRFSNAQSLDDATHAFVWGYVRPTGKEASYNNRRRVAGDIYDLLYKEDS